MSTFLHLSLFMLKICCDPESQKKYPNYPNCTCSPENFAQPFVCTSIGVNIAVDAAGVSAEELSSFNLRDALTWRHQKRVEWQKA